MTRRMERNRLFRAPVSTNHPDRVEDDFMDDDIVPTDMSLLGLIVDRFEAIQRAAGKQINRSFITFNVIFCHFKCIPLNMEKLLNLDDANFMADMNSLYEHFNRRTRHFSTNFIPNCAFPTKAA